MVFAALAGCGDDGQSTAPANDSSEGGQTTTVYAPRIDPSMFVAVIDNPYHPLAVGSTWRYEGTDSEGAPEVVEITVLDETRR